MAKYRSKEDDVNRISISIFVMNFPESFSAKDLFHTCKQYGHVVDSFIPSKRTKEARFQRKPLNEMSTSAKTVGENNRGGDKSSRLFGGAMGNGNSYINVLKSSNGVGRLESHSPDIVLDDECVISKELSYSLMEEEEQSDVGSLEGDNKMNEDYLCGDNMDMVDVPETVFDESNGQKKDVSHDPFGIYPMLNKKTNEKNDKDHSPKGVWLKNGIDLTIIAVYAPHDPIDKFMLWEYLGNVVNQWHGEVVLMGDFNEVRCKSDRFGSHFNVQGANVFNSFIVNAGLEEVPIGGSAFTWCHKSATKMSKLDRFLVSNNLLNICPHISVITLERYLSDHKPILLRESIHDYGPVLFRFFHHWLELDGFYTFVSDTWINAPEDRSNGMRNMTGVGTEEVVNKRVEVLNSLRYIDQMHAMDLAQKAKIKWSIEGDENSSFFHGMLNKKRNQSNIRGIMVDDVWKEQPNDIKKEFLNHFQERFDKPVERRVTTDMSYPRSISGEQRDELEREVTIEDIKTAMWNCGTDKSPSPDGFTFDFYRQFWSTIDKDVYAAVNHFFINEDIPAGCNSSFIALIPKVPDANLVKDFRPISLIGSIYKIIA
nr:RNA-directed DNA polymerase, eukaryota [Tanacetum cinerariifolium]